MRFNSVCFFAVMCALAQAASVQMPDPANPTFHAGAHLGEIDVVVRGKTAPAPMPLPKGAVSNRVDSSGQTLPSATVVLIDQLNTSVDLKGYAAKSALESVRGLSAGDRVAIYSLGMQE